jgi:hypothetical protein
MSNGSFTNPGASLVDLRSASADRLAEANDLFQQARYGSAIAMALYSLEIYLKVRICLTLDLDDLPVAFQIHRLDALLVLSGFKKRMDQLGTHPVKSNWDSLKVWAANSPHVGELRYKPNATWTRAEAEDILRKIQDPNEGVLTWLLAQP